VRVRHQHFHLRRFGQRGLPGCSNWVLPDWKKTQLQKTHKITIFNLAFWNLQRGRPKNFPLRRRKFQFSIWHSEISWQIDANTSLCNAYANEVALGTATERCGIDIGPVVNFRPWRRAKLKITKFAKFQFSIWRSKVCWQIAGNTSLWDCEINWIALFVWTVQCAIEMV
jgi:hypothetical protein